MNEYKRESSLTLSAINGESVVDTYGDLQLPIVKGVNVKAAVLPEARENILAENQLR